MYGEYTYSLIVCLGMQNTQFIRINIYLSILKSIQMTSEHMIRVLMGYRLWFAAKGGVVDWRGKLFIYRFTKIEYSEQKLNSLNKQNYIQFSLFTIVLGRMKWLIQSISFNGNSVWIDWISTRCNQRADRALGTL